MAEIKLNEHVKISNVGPEALAMANAREISKVVLWDKGPQKPVMPKQPATPDGKPGEPKYELAMVEFKAVLEAYDVALKAYRQAVVDFADFEKKYGGPYELEMWSCDAHDALQRDPDRYIVSNKTRGHERLKNGGLPIGMKPGHGQAAQQRRAAEHEAEFETARRADPVFGQEVPS